jgi:hypothetical protein
LNEIVDVGYVFLLADKMHSIMRQRIVYAKDKDRYREYYSELSEIDDDLQKAGFRSEYIDKVLDVNVNRPDRDDISKIDVSKIYNLEKIEADEDKPDN